MSDLTDKQGNEIEVGDTVFMNYRAGKMEGKVDEILSTEDDVANSDLNVKNPPKVVFTNQNNKQSGHNPGTLTDLDKD
ncbi:hypothetical protein L198_06841 [Cryptococcus wingfieldii CBS 7118]|uniref:Hypervirulence associated protein TUDOR domain-containing protein n=1 Tax=Cryptococcus wingfieldii CBS 7118 TaxID=1295528 RepID=A0A1E3IHL3_9TREE|nr:hypothetical protein L198_06841 [Cryptococcus wingfieldii CBS 7118]ODN88082.1 hypothetical protein L198_06841 [Cryptococcus wingfieldii CBS 7118]